MSSGHPRGRRSLDAGKLLLCAALLLRIRPSCPRGAGSNGPGTLPCSSAKGGERGSHPRSGCGLSRWSCLARASGLAYAAWPRPRAAGSAKEELGGAGAGAYDCRGRCRRGRRRVAALRSGRSGRSSRASSSPVVPSLQPLARRARARLAASRIASSSGRGARDPPRALVHGLPAADPGARAVEGQLLRRARLVRPGAGRVWRSSGPVADAIGCSRRCGGAFAIELGCAGAAILACRRCGRSAARRPEPGRDLTSIGARDERPRPHGSAARPGSSTSAASTRSSSTGCSPADAAASACCGSRTPTRAARSRRRSSRSSARCVARDRLGRPGDVPARRDGSLPRARRAPRRGGQGVRGRGRDPLPHARRGRHRLGRRGPGPDRGAERAARGRRDRPLGRARRRTTSPRRSRTWTTRSRT